MKLTKNDMIFIIVKFKFIPVMPILLSIARHLLTPLQANVVCRQLGFTHALKMHLGSYFGQVNGKFSLGMVKCIGNESSIGECTHLNLVDCKPTEVAGVTCANPLSMRPAFPQCKYASH